MELTMQQLQTIKAAILADSALLALYNTAPSGEQLAADALNLAASATFTVWKTSVTTREMGEAFNSSEVGGLTTANTNRLIVMQAYSGGVFNPSRTDTRAGFDGVFSGAGGALTRAALLVLYKRLALRAEKILATGTGSDAVPATLGWEGQITYQDVRKAMMS